MQEDQFWRLIETSAGSSSKAARLAWLDAELSARPLDDVVHFQLWLWRSQQRANTWDLFAAYNALFFRGSSDGFMYFQMWLIGLGKIAFCAAVNDPDALSGIPRVESLLRLIKARMASNVRPIWSDEESPEFEELAYVAFGVYERSTGRDAFGLPEAVELLGESNPGFELRGARWNLSDYEERSRRFPRITHFWDQP